MTQTQDAPPDGNDAMAGAEAFIRPTVHTAIAQVISDAARRGVGQDGVNVDQKYRYRSYYALVSTLSPLIGAAGLTILPTAIEITESTKPTRSGGTMHVVIVRMTWEITGPAGDSVTIPGIGTGSDVSDKAVAKALTAAHKSLLTLVFLVPFAEPDEDERTPDIDHAPPPPDPAASIKLDLWRKLHNSGLEADAARDLVASEAAQLDTTPEAATLAQWQQISEALLRGDGPADPATTSEEDQQVGGEPKMASDKQLGLLGVRFGLIGMRDPAERLWACGELVGKQLVESADLTAEDASTVLDKLANILGAAGGHKPGYKDADPVAAREALEQLVARYATEREAN